MPRHHFSVTRRRAELEHKPKRWYIHYVLPHIFLTSRPPFPSQPSLPSLSLGTLHLLLSFKSSIVWRSANPGWYCLIHQYTVDYNYYFGRRRFSCLWWWNEINQRSMSPQWKILKFNCFCKTYINIFKWSIRTEGIRGSHLNSLSSDSQLRLFVGEYWKTPISYSLQAPTVLTGTGGSLHCRTWLQLRCLASCASKPGIGGTTIHLSLVEDELPNQDLHWQRGVTSAPPTPREWQQWGTGHLSGEEIQNSSMQWMSKL